MKPRSVTLSRIVVTLSLLFVAGCSSATATPPSSISTPTAPPPTEVATATAAPVATNTPLPAGTPTPTTGAAATPTPAPSPTPSIEQPLAVASIHMVTATEGWATGSVAAQSGSSGPAPSGNVYRTTDGAMHWQDVTPSGVMSDTATSAYFLDASHGWVAAAPAPGTSNAGSSTIIVYRTADGGQTWDHGTPISISSGGGPSSFDFVDAQHGWLMVALSAGVMHEAVAIYSTTDGGMAWQQVSLTSDQQGQSTPESLPFVCDKSGVGFADANTGWAAGACPGGPLFFYVTHDGGQTWQPQTMPAPSGYTTDLYSQCQCAVSRPTFATPQVGFVTIQIYEQQPRAVLYITQDGGTSWTPRDLPVLPLAGGGPDFVDAKTGWLTGGKQLYVTQDAGQTWNAVGALPLPGEDLRSVDFVDANNGWLLGQKLYVTHDGGESWSGMTPVVTAGQTTFTDPFAYCAAVGTADTPGPRYTGPKVPESIAKGLQTALNSPNIPPDVLSNGSFWRCMDGNVYACFVGANLPCESKANTDRTPTQAEKDFCQQQPDSDFIPAYVTGHDTIYEWRCTNGTPEIVKQVFQVDPQGFIADIWYQIKPNE